MPPHTIGPVLGRRHCHRDARVGHRHPDLHADRPSTDHPRRRCRRTIHPRRGRSAVHLPADPRRTGSRRRRHLAPDREQSGLRSTVAARAAHVDRSFNNLVPVPDQHLFGAADLLFPRLTGTKDVNGKVSVGSSVMPTTAPPTNRRPAPFSIRRRGSSAT